MVFRDSDSESRKPDSEPSPEAILERNCHHYTHYTRTMDLESSLSTFQTKLEAPSPVP